MMKLLLFLLIGLAAPRCSHFEALGPAESSPVYTTPSRALVLLFDGLSPEDLASPDAPHFRELAKRALPFPEARVGHIMAQAEVSLTVIGTGLLPGRLPWGDPLWKLPAPPKARARFAEVARLPPSELSSALVPFAKTSLSANVRAEAPALVVAAKQWETMLLAGGAEGKSVKTVSSNGDTLVTARLVAGLMSRPWRSLVAFLGDPPPAGLTRAERTARLKEADTALGLILSAFDLNHLEGSTALIVTSLHGSGSAPPTPRALPAELAALQASPVVMASQFGDTLRFWLSRKDPVAIAQFGSQLRSVPGVAEIYTKHVTGEAAHYIRTFKTTPSGAAPDRERANGKLVETMASLESPEVVAPLLSGWNYAPLLEPGGTDEQIQRIPFIVRSPSLRVSPGAISSYPVRLVDVPAIVARLLGAPVPDTIDGTSDMLSSWIARHLR